MFIVHEYVDVILRFNRTAEINPPEITPQIVTPVEEPRSWCAYPGDNPLGSTTASTDRDRHRSRRHIFSSSYRSAARLQTL